MLPREDHQNGETLVPGKAMLCASRNEVHRPLAERKLLPLDIEDSSAFEDDIDLVVGMRLLAVGSGATSTYTPISRQGD